MADSDTLKQENAARKQWARYLVARNGHRKYIEDAEKFRRFYAGDQWAQEDLAKLQREGRPALTINQILPTINTMLGEQAANRADIRFKPRRMGDDATASLLHKVTQSVLDDNQFQWKESEVFADGLIEDRGYFDIRMDFDKNVFGDIDIDVLDPSHVIPDPDGSEYDPDTWNEVFITWWKSVDEVEADYGKEAADKVRLNGANGATNAEVTDTDAFRFRKTFGEGHHETVVPEGQGQYELRSVRLVERQYRVRHRGKQYVTQYGDLVNVPEVWSDERIQAHAEEQGYYIVEREISRIRWTVTAGEGVLLFDDWSPYESFTVVPFFPYYRRGRAFGVVRNLISPQEQLNKTESQELHIINTTANSGWMIQKGSLPAGKTAADVEREGSKTGFVLEYNAGFNPPEKIQPNQVPTGVDRLSVKSTEAIRAISGIHQAMQGNASPEMSGRALSSQISRGQVQMQKPLDNLARTRHIVARMLLRLIQTYYTEERVIYMTNDLEPEATEEEVVINQQTAQGVINDVTVGDYAIVISQQPARDSYRETQFSNAFELRQLGVAIPDWILVRYSNLEGREELAQMLRKAAGQAEPTEQEQQLAEFQQQAQIQDIQLSLATKEAELQKKQAEVQNIVAKTDSESDPNAIKNVIELMKLQKDVQLERENLEARMMMSQMSNEAQRQRSDTQALIQARGQDSQQDTAITTAMLSLNAAADRSSSTSKGE